LTRCATSIAAVSGGAAVGDDAVTASLLTISARSLRHRGGQRKTWTTARRDTLPYPANL
jgi:hypothetical protein